LEGHQSSTMRMITHPTATRPIIAIFQSPAKRKMIGVETTNSRQHRQIAAMIRTFTRQV